MGRGYLERLDPVGKFQVVYLSREQQISELCLRIYEAENGHFPCYILVQHFSWYDNYLMSKFYNNHVKISDLLKDAAVSTLFIKGTNCCCLSGHQQSIALNPTELGQIWPEVGQSITSTFKIQSLHRRTFHALLFSTCGCFPLAFGVLVILLG